MLHSLKRTVNFVFGRMVMMLKKTWVLLPVVKVSVVGMLEFSSYDKYTRLLSINPTRGHFAATPKEYAVTFSTINSIGSVQN